MSSNPPVHASELHRGMRNKSACPRHLLLAVLLSGAVLSNARAECVGYVPTCSLRTSAAVVFLGTLESESNRVYHFRVDEPFNGVNGKSIDVLDVPMVEGFSGFAGVDRQYLVFASTIKLDDGVYTHRWMRTQPGRNAVRTRCSRAAAPGEERTANQHRLRHA